MTDRAEIDAFLETAEAVCRRSGVRFTDTRKRTLLAMLQVGRPVKAYDLLPALGRDGEPAKPATAYRALEFLEAVGLVHKIAGMNAFIVCKRGGGAHVTSLYICERCGDAYEHIMAHAHSCDPPPGFTVTRSVHEHYGVCAACARA